MRLAERATVSNFERFKPPYVGVTVHSVIRPVLNPDASDARGQSSHLVQLIAPSSFYCVTNPSMQRCRELFLNFRALVKSAEIRKQLKRFMTIFAKR